jgi:hypothetical protein
MTGALRPPLLLMQVGALIYDPLGQRALRGRWISLETCWSACCVLTPTKLGHAHTAFRASSNEQWRIPVVQQHLLPGLCNLCLICKARACDDGRRPASDNIRLYIACIHISVLP